MHSRYRAGLVCLVLSILLGLTIAAPIHPKQVGRSSSIEHHSGSSQLLVHPFSPDTADESNLSRFSTISNDNEGVAARDVVILERRNFWDTIKRGFQRLGGAIKSVAQKIGNGIKSVAQKIGSGIKRAAQTVGNGIKSVAQKIGSGIKRAAQVVGNGIKTAAQRVGSGIKKAAQVVGNGIKTAAQKVGSGIKTAAQRVGTFMKTTGAVIAKVGLKVISTVQQAASKVVQFIPVIGKPLSKVMGMESKALNMASNAIPAQISGKLGSAMQGMDTAEKVMEYIPRQELGDDTLQDRGVFTLRERDLYQINILLARQNSDSNRNWL